MNFGLFIRLRICNVYVTVPFALCYGVVIAIDGLHETRWAKKSNRLSLSNCLL